MAKLVTICGSMRFADTMMQAARVLETKQGCIALQCVYLAPGDALTQDEIADAHSLGKEVLYWEASNESLPSAAELT